MDTNDDVSFSDQFTQEVTELFLDPKHPGVGDEDYCRRRKEFFDLARQWRLGEKGVPLVEYIEEEKALWKPLNARLSKKHEERASSIYLTGCDELEIDKQNLPQLVDVAKKLEQVSGFRITPAEGLLSFREFFSHIADGIMPCTQYLRHHSQPAYTPEPDMVHDVVGHVPVLANRAYIDFIRMIGEASREATDEQLEAFNRLYWFTIEFGLIQEKSDLKILGAGILSSDGEMDFCYSDEVDRRRFSMDEIVQLDYDPTQMQKTLFVIPSFEELISETKELVRRFERDRRS